MHDCASAWPPRDWLFRAALAAMALLCWAALVDAAPRTADPLGEDADLADIQFVDPEWGYAVGDRGVIWHTADGGRNWKRQNTGVECRLQSVCFLSREVGWAAGGQTNPYTHSTTGVVLFTHDGGRRWSVRSGREIPTLKRVKFFDPENGVAMGEPSAIFPTGLFTTDNGGKSWRPVHGARTNGWLAGDFRDPTLGAVAGRSGELAAVRQRTLVESRTPANGLRGLRRMALATEVDGWLVGDGALVLMTNDLGKSWQAPAAPLPIEATPNFDFAALATIGPRAWIAGTPGTRVLHTPDAGRSWQWLETGQPLPIAALSFVTPEQGWAAGALGTILATRDGGRTWQRQRSGGTRAAYLAMYAEPEDLPLELVARLSGNEGYLGVLHLVSRRDQGPANLREATLSERTHEAFTAVGGSRTTAGWQFPLPPVGLGWKAQHIVGTWNAEHDGRALEHLEAQLVREIRTWRPDVLFTHAATPDPTRPLAHLMNQTVLAAADKAADPTWYPDQLTLGGLKAWKARKAFGSLPAGTLGEVTLETTRLALRLGHSFADYAATPRGLIEVEPSPAPAAWGFQACLDRIPQEGGRKDFMAGIALHPGGEARRELLDAAPDAISLQKRMAEKRRNLDAILARTSKTEQGSLKLLGQVGDLVRDLDDQLAGQILFNTAQQHYRQGHGDLAAETFDLLVAKYPEHPLSAKALVWLLQYWASSETAWRMQRAQQTTDNRGTFHVDPNVKLTSGSSDDKGSPRTAERGTTGVDLRRGTHLSLDDRQLIDRPAKAMAMAKWMERSRPDLFHEPHVRFPLSTAQRRSGLGGEADKFLLNLRQGREQDVWWACAEGERWLEKPYPNPPKGIARAMKGQTKPRLDGRLDDTLWKTARPLVLASPLRNDEAWPAVCRVAYDAEFLYLAVECRKAPEFVYQPPQGPRTRDPDLSAQDRVQIYLDVDRDYATYYRLTIDHRGHVAEDCWGDTSWNPQWFVAADTAEGSWTAEAAIPLDELTGKSPEKNGVWCLGVTRMVPGVGFQSWTLPAAPVVQPEGFGYLIFE